MRTKQSPEPIEIDRRNFLTSTAVLATFPAIAKVDVAKSAATLIPNAAVSTISKPNIAISGRIAEIARRNVLRKETGLPLLSVSQEIRRAKTVEARQTFEAFSETFRDRVRDKTLARTRRRRVEPNWTPKGMGMYFGFEVSRNLRRLYERIG